MYGKITMTRDTLYVANKKQLARNLNNRQLKKRLCSAGPAMCSSCLLCEFGKEHLSREALKKGAV